MRASPAWLFVLSVVTACATAGPARLLQQRLDAARPGETIMLPPGTYTDELVIRQPVTLSGSRDGDVLLSSRNPLTIASRGVILEGLRLQAGDTAVHVLSHGIVAMRRMTIEAGAVGVRADAEGDVSVEDSRVSCAKPGAVGVQSENAIVRVARAGIDGPCRHDVAATGGALLLHRLRLAGAQDAGVHAVDARLEVTDSEILGLGPRASGLFASRGKVDVTGLRVQGGENGLLLRDTDAKIEELSVSGSSMAGLALTGAKADLTRAEFSGPFSEGAIAVVNDSQVKLTQVRVTGAGSAGVFAVAARVEANKVSIDGASMDKSGDYGDGLTFTRSTAILEDIKVTGAEGAALYATNPNSSVDVQGIAVSNSGAAIASMNGAHVSVRRMDVHRTSVGLVVGHRGTITAAESKLAIGIFKVIGGEGTIDDKPSIDVYATAENEKGPDPELDRLWVAILHGPRPPR